MFVSEAARIIGVADQTLKTWERIGRLVPQRIGSVRVFDRAECERVAVERQAAKVAQKGAK